MIINYKAPKYLKNYFYHHVQPQVSISACYSIDM